MHTNRLIERDLYCFGMEVLLDLDLALLRDFFGAFFANPRERGWREFLAVGWKEEGAKKRGEGEGEGGRLRGSARG